jgi:hypothetical protein
MIKSHIPEDFIIQKAMQGYVFVFVRVLMHLFTVALHGIGSHSYYRSSLVRPSPSTDLLSRLHTHHHSSQQLFSTS